MIPNLVYGFKLRLITLMFLNLQNAKEAVFGAKKYKLMLMLLLRINSSNASSCQAVSV